MPAPPPFVRVCSFSSEHGGDGTVEDFPAPGLESLSNAYGFSPVLSAPAPSRMEIWVPEDMPVRGFLGGAADHCDGAVLRVDGDFLGRVRTAYDVTPEKWLAPGVHLLETTVDGRHAGCHTIWGFGPSPWLEQEPEHYLAAGAVCRTADDRLTEWVEHHLEAGVSHFHLLDTGVPGMLARIIEEAGLSSVVTVESFPGTDGCSPEAVLHLLRRWGPKCFWMALLGTDDFLTPKLSDSLAEIVSAFEEYGGLLVPHALSPSNGNASRISEGTAVGRIVRPLFVADASCWDTLVMRPGRPLVGEHFSAELSGGHLEIRPSPPSPAEKRFQRKSSSRSELSKHEPPEITGFIHVAAVNHWEAVLGLQLAKIRKSGLLEKTSVIHLGISGARSDIVAGSEILRQLPHKVKIACVEPELSRYEFPTLEHLQRHCRRHDGQVWYIHTKGVVNTYHIQRAWRNRMEEFVIIHHRLAAAKLAKGYVTAAGYGSTDERWPVPGNFWWATCRHIRSLPDIETVDRTNRHEAERWIGMNGTGGFYLHDNGDTLFEGWEITAAETGADPLTTGGYHGWTRLPVLPPANTLADHLISAHAPSVIALSTRVPLRIFGFTCRTADENGWRVEFLINDRPVGLTGKSNWGSREIWLSPGRHCLQVRISGSTPQGAHTGWGVSPGTEISCGNTGPLETFIPWPLRPDCVHAPLLSLEHRTGIIQSLVELRGYRSYLEIGIGDGRNFRAVRCADKVSVDPAGTPVHRMTSDDFFASNTRTFDLIFVDGLHEEAVVARDLENALKALNPGGAVVCHDLNPANEAVQLVPRSTLEWTGDCWKAWVKLRSRLSGCLMTVFDTDYGVGVLIPDARHPNPLSVPLPADPVWRDFEANRRHWLDLRSPAAAWEVLQRDGWRNGPEG